MAAFISSLAAGPTCFAMFAHQTAVKHSIPHPKDSSSNPLPPESVISDNLKTSTLAAFNNVQFMITLKPVASRGLRTHIPCI